MNSPAVAQFTIEGFKKGDWGFVIIYQCLAENEKLINPATLNEKSSNESYQEIARVKFKVGDRSIYEFLDQHQSSPGSASLQVRWQPKQLPENKTNKLCFYRFAIELNNETEIELSSAMQWFIPNGNQNSGFNF